MTQDKELVVRALRRLAEETRGREDPAAHPSVEELVAYHASELSPEEDRAIQRHLAVCAECPGLILALDSFANLPEEELEITRSGVDSAWEKVRQQLAEEGWFQSDARGVSRYALFAPPRRLVATMAAVTLACLGLYVVLQAPAARQPRIVAEQEAISPQWELHPPERGQVQTIGDAASAKGFTLVASPEGRWSSPEYRVELWKDGPTPGRPLWSGGWRPASPLTPLFLRLPSGYLPSADYRLELHCVVDGRRLAEPEDQRRFRLSFQ